MSAEETGRFTRLRGNDSVLEVASLSSCAWGYNLAPEHSQPISSCLSQWGSQPGIVGQGLIAAGLFTQRQWGGMCPRHPLSLQITAQESCCTKQDLKNCFRLFPGMAAQPELPNGCLIHRPCRMWDGVDKQVLATLSRLCSVGELSGSCAIADEGSWLMRFPQKKLLLLGHLFAISLKALLLSQNRYVRSLAH